MNQLVMIFWFLVSIATSIAAKWCNETQNSTTLRTVPYTEEVFKYRNTTYCKFHYAEDPQRCTYSERVPKERVETHHSITTVSKCCPGYVMSVKQDNCEPMCTVECLSGRCSLPNVCKVLDSPGPIVRACRSPKFVSANQTKDNGKEKSLLKKIDKKLVKALESDDGEELKDQILKELEKEVNKAVDVDSRKFNYLWLLVLVIIVVAICTCLYFFESKCLSNILGCLVKDIVCMCCNNNDNEDPTEERTEDEEL